MQQQAALMAAAQGTCLNPMAAIAAAQMQQMAAFNVSGLVAAPMTPSSGTSTPPGISTAPVPSIATPIGVNGFSPLPPQTNGQPASETIYTNGIHPYPAQSPTVADPLQQAYAGMQHYAGLKLCFAILSVSAFCAFSVSWFVSVALYLLNEMSMKRTVWGKAVGRHRGRKREYVAQSYNSMFW
uniref:Uncharacterized protein n=1 Tax=Pelusios castaneus TaxID=367368 RepID=A0A8C8RHM8_9SAUR